MKPKNYEVLQRTYRPYTYTWALYI